VRRRARRAGRRARRIARPRHLLQVEPALLVEHDRAKKSLSAVSATVTRAGAPGTERDVDAAQRQRLPVEERRPGRASRTSASAAPRRRAARQRAGGAEVVDARVAAHRDARLGGLLPRDRALEAGLRRCTSRLVNASR
jgi:hypothetical protein